MNAGHRCRKERQQDCPAKLRGEVENWDVVIYKPVAQSGVRWFEAFAETVFFGGEQTLPPNICDGQAARREPTALICVLCAPDSVETVIAAVGARRGGDPPGAAPDQRVGPIP